MVQTLCVAMLASLVTVFAPASARALEAIDESAITFNMQGGTRWNYVRSSLIKDADVLALQEATTPPSDFARTVELGNNLNDPTQTATGLPSLKYRLYAQRWGKPGRGTEEGVLLYLDILDRNLWGAGTSIDPDDPDTQGNSQKSMAIWLRHAPQNLADLRSRITILPAQDTGNRWIRSRPAFGVQVNGTWYFDIHAASIRSGDTPNPHAVALINTVARAMPGQRWRALGDFNSHAAYTRNVFPTTFYPTVNGAPDGTPVPTQLSGFPLDFMVASDQLSNLVVAGNNQNDGSDHWPVRFARLNSPTCNSDWSKLTYYNQAGARRVARAAGDACGSPSAVVSMGDSYISGEGGRWAGNAASSAAGSAWGTDRAAVNCNGDETACDRDLSKVYGDTSYGKGGSACDRSDSAEIKGVKVAGVPVERRFNIACSGAVTDNITTTGFKGQRTQIDDLRDIAKNNDVRLVALSIGGNDLKFSDILQDCVKAYFSPSQFNKGCRGAKEKDFAEALEPVQDKVVQSVEAIRKVLSEAGQEEGSYQIVLQSYPNPLPRGRDYRDPEDAPLPPDKYSRYLSGGCPFLDADSDWANTSVVPRISAMLRSAANKAGVSFLDLQDAFAGHELCSRNAQQANTAHKLSSPLQAEHAEWVRFVPYLFEGVKNLPWQSQGHQQEAVHPNYYGQLALSACLTKVAEKLGTSPVTSACVGKPFRSGDSVDTTVDTTNQVLSKSNRRAPMAGLPDWSRAGYHGGETLPGAASRTTNAACHITPLELETRFKVKPDDGQDDTEGLQKAIDHIRTACTPNAAPGRLSVIELPKGVLNVSKQLSVDASYLVIRGQGADPKNGSRIVFRPDESTRYDTLNEKGERWEQAGMRHECKLKLGSYIGTGGWIWPGRGLFRVQTREVAEKYTRVCDYPSKIPENRRDLFEGSINQHWDSGVTVSGAAADANYAARQGDRVIQVDPQATMGVFKPGGYLWVGAANSLKFYQSQEIPASVEDPKIQNLHMRQQVFTITAVDPAKHTVTIDKPLEFDLPVNSTSDGSPPLELEDKPYASKVTPLKMITDVGFEDFSFTQDINGLPKLKGGTYQLTPTDAVNNYGNMAPEYAMHGIVFKWASDSWVRGVRADMTGSHPVVTEVAKNIQIERNVFDGAWNKGKGGNGYLRGSRVWDSLYAFNTSRNLRHFTFQWSASGNVALGNDFDSDLNLHGGWERRNLFENNTVRVPYDHRSGKCTANCGGEGGAGDKGTWWPIYWTAGAKGIGWSGATGPQNIFFRNNLIKQAKAGGPFEPYQPYTDTSRVYQFGSAAGDPSIFQHLKGAAGPIQDWADNERGDYTRGDGVNASRTDSGTSLFLRDYSS
ncbi:endonuclease/exonuclease/phosphatase family protein [Streptomyces sp. NPDC037389]|uniref:endonuclease/exonuclease/phosphatase family protein n=1 Tax=Streptomyces sp. NPDC037389 TaxID=3155369 RepID=UPI0033F40D3D